jgi:alpha-L-rhamnosidase
MNIVKKFLGAVLGVVVLVAGLDGVTASAALSPVNLRCALRVNPLGIGDANPRLSWQLQSTGQLRGETQSAYQIQVGSAAGAADLWDSGKVTNAATMDIVYAGKALTSGENCFWQVRVYDGSNNVSAWSAPAQWSMGLLGENDWTAQWIGYDAAYDLTPQQATNAALFNTSGLSWISYSGQTLKGGLYQSSLRKKVILPSSQTVTNAVMALYADNYCSVFVNGQQMTNAAMRWEATAQINVTSWLHAGTNVLALSATNSDAQQPATVIGRLVVQFASGSVSNIPVDTSWKAAQWPAAGWTQTNYDDSAWATPSSGGTPWGTPALNDLARVPAPYLRKNFTVGQTVTRATVYVTALGAYELHLNGQKVGNDVLTPGWTQFTKRVYYQTYDVTGMVQGGANTLSAILGDGWYASDLAFEGKRCNYGGTPRFLAQLVLQLSDGSMQTVVSDASWKASYGPIQFGDLLLGSGYDARREMPGWDTTNFNDNAWSPVITGLSAGAAGYTNVTTLVTSYVSDNQLNFVASNDNLGGDPAYNIVKTLQITYQIGGGTNQTQSFAENATVSIGVAGKTLTIIQALYGNAAAFPGVGGLQVQAAVTEPARCLETIAATNLTVPKPGCYTFDLGQNMVGWVRLNISGSVGDRITVRHGEMLNPDGSIYAANLRGANATDFYIFATNGTVVFEPRFTFHGFRYVEVRGLTVPPTLSSLTGIVVHSDLPQTGDFACSSPLVNRLFSNIIWGQKGNYLEVPSDCPQRDERMGWTGDTEFFVPTAAYNYDVQSFFRRHMVTFCEDAQQASGAYAVVVPDMNQGYGGTAWGDAGWICPYNMYRAYGDTNIIADHYASYVRCGQFDAANASNYVISSLPGDFGDWVNLDNNATSSKVMDTAFYAYYAQAMSEMATAIGNSADAATYATLHSNIVAAFANFFNADGSFTDGSGQTGYALAFTLNLVPAGLRPQVAQQFANSIASYNNHLATGFIGTPRLLPALHAAGRDDLAYTLLLQETYPSWLYQVKLGATTMWERWDGWTPTGGFQTIGMNSFNHYAFGAVGQYLYSTVAGINPASPSYQTILIQPVPGNGLTWAHASYNSARGLISTAWTNTGSAFNLDVVIPPNTTAQIYVPTTNASAITESGVPATNSPGVTYVGVSNSYAIYAVGSGHYVWTSPFTIPVVPSTVITMTNQTGTTGSYPYTPTWTVVTNGDLILGQAPSATNGNFNMEPYSTTRNVNSLTDGGSLTITTNGNPFTTSGNYVTCGNGAGSLVIYSLTNSASGYDLTNITVYGGWGDNGRDQQAYTVYYSTVTAPTNFIPLAVVNFNPSIANHTPSATRVTLTSSSGALATNVAAVKFDFSSPTSENAFCGYAEIAIFGTASYPAPVVLTNPSPVTAVDVVGSQVAFIAAFNGSSPMTYQWRKDTGTGPVPIPGATNTVLTLTNLQLTDAAVYSLQASNALAVVASAASSLTVSSVPAAVNNVIVSPAAQTGTGTGTFTPTWTAVTNRSLIAGKTPSSTAGDFSLEVSGRSVNSLTAGGDFGITEIPGASGYPITTTPDYVTCGNGGGAGSLITYTLTGSASGSTLTNIMVYGGWADAGRDQQAYTVYYSTLAAPTNFTALATVNYNPSNAANAQSATRVTMTAPTGVLATNVAAVKFNFTSPASENGYCGYNEIALFGIANSNAVPITLSAVSGTGRTSFQMSVSGLSVGQGYTLQSTTNLTSAVWSAETNFVATQTAVAFTNALADDAQKFYRLVEN